MSTKRHGTSAQRPCIQHMSTIADFQVIRCDEAGNTEEMLKVQKCFYNLDHVVRSSHHEGVHVRTSMGNKITNIGLRDLPLSLNASSFRIHIQHRYLYLARFTIILRLNRHILQLGVHKVVKEYAVKFFDSD